MMDELASALFEPGSIALIGASSDLSRPNGRPLKYLQKHGYRGEIYPINPRHGEIAGIRCYPRLEDVGGLVEHAFVMVSAKDAIESIIRSCGEAGVRCATILAGGFAETGAEGRLHQDRLLSIARQAGVRILGPNSIGTINPGSGIGLSANAVLDLPRLTAGSTAVISQSGSLVGAILSHGQGAGFSKLVSVGNEADLSVGEVGKLLLDDDATEAILLFLETLRSRDLLTEFSEQAARLGKPVIAYHVGRSELGSRIAQSHTGALATSEKAIGAFLDDHGIARVGMFESFVESPRVFAGRRPADHGRAGGAVVITTSGGGGTMVIDSLARCGVQVSHPPDRIAERLRHCGIAHEPHHMIDLTMAGARPEVVSGVIADLADCEDVGAAIMVVGSSAQFHPELAVEPLLHWAGHEMPLLVYLTPQADSSRRMLTRAGIPVFRSPEACAEAARALLCWRTPRAPCEDARIAARNALPIVHGTLAAAAALDLFEALGIEVAARGLASDAAEASRTAERIGYPVALKISSPDISHKSDIGGVRLGISDGAAVSRAFDSLLRDVRSSAPNARVQGVLVQEMIEASVETIVGYRRDPVAGPVIMLGAGGLMAEIYRDTMFAVAPVTPEIARRMVDQVKGLAPATGYRGHPKGDIPALVAAIVAVSRLALNPHVAEAEINPLMVRGEGCGAIAVDGLFVGTGDPEGTMVAG